MQLNLNPLNFSEVVNKSFPTTGTFNISPKVYIWGNPLDYSLSIFFQEHASALNGTRIIYRPFRGEAEHFRELLKEELCAGANITMPYKTEAAKLCDALTQRAIKAGSVNTLYKTDSGITGDSTDGEGLFKWMEMNNRLSPRIQILGNGGSARAVASFFFEKGIEVTVCGRSFKGWEENFGRFIHIEKRDNSAVTVNTLPFSVEGENILNINYQFGNISEAASGMLGCQGALSAAKWFKNEPLFDLFVELSSLHAASSMNTRLIEVLTKGGGNAL
jgi:shikimate 5-dehydrogenase